jgi:hypothetical protein
MALEECGYFPATGDKRHHIGVDSQGETPSILKTNRNCILAALIAKKLDRNAYQKQAVSL